MPGIQSERRIGSHTEHVCNQLDDLSERLH